MNIIKKGDTVKIITGKDRGKSGKVLHLLRSAVGKKNRLMVVVDGLNLRYKHVRPKRANEKGQRIQFPAPLDFSNVALLCPKCSAPVRPSFGAVAKADAALPALRQRLCRRCQAVI